MWHRQEIIKAHAVSKKLQSDFEDHKHTTSMRKDAKAKYQPSKKKSAQNAEGEADLR